MQENSQNSLRKEKTFSLLEPPPIPARNLDAHACEWWCYGSIDEDVVRSFFSESGPTRWPQRNSVTEVVRSKVYAILSGRWVNILPLKFIAFPRSKLAVAGFLSSVAPQGSLRCS